MRKFMAVAAAIILAAPAASVLALGLDIKTGLGIGSLNPPKVDNLTDITTDTIEDSTNAVVGEGVAAIRLNKKLSGGLSVNWSLTKYDTSGLAGNWEVTQGLFAGNVFGQYNILTGRVRPYLKATAGMFGRGLAVVDRKTRSLLLVAEEDWAVHAAVGLGGEFAITHRTFFYGELQYHHFGVEAEKVAQINGILGIGYTFADIYDF